MSDLLTDDELLSIQSAVWARQEGQHSGCGPMDQDPLVERLVQATLAARGEVAELEAKASKRGFLMALEAQDASAAARHGALADAFGRLWTISTSRKIAGKRAAQAITSAAADDPLVNKVLAQRRDITFHRW